MTTAPVETTAPTEAPVTRRAAGDIQLHPFTEQEKEAAEAAATGWLEEKLENEPGILTHELHTMAYDPIMTDVYVLELFYDSADSAAMTVEELHSRHISFAVTYSATFDETLSDRADADNGVFCVTLSRETVDSPWQVIACAPAEEHSHEAMGYRALSAFSWKSGRILGGYALDEGGYWFYVWEDEPQTSRMVKVGAD